MYETVLNDAMLATVVSIHFSHGNAERTRNKRVQQSMLPCKLTDNQAAHSLDQDANFKHFEPSSWMFDNPACRHTPEDLLSPVH